MRPLPAKTIKLPRKLLDELGESGGPNGNRSAQNSRIAKRKERRRAERSQKRVRRQRQVDGNYGFEGVKGPKVVKPGIGKSLNIRTRRAEETIQPKSILKPTDHHAQGASRDGASLSPARIPRGLRGRLAEDDAEIAALERKLGIRSKKLPKAFVDDGLDILLDGLEEDDELLLGGGKRKKAGGDEWLESKRRSARAVKDTEANGDGSLSTEGGDDGGVRAPRGGEGSVELLQGGHGLSDSVDNLPGSELYSSDSSTILVQKSRENPYVAPASTPKVLQSVKYVPPSLRKSSTSESETLLRLSRQMQGLLNRLSEANLLSILGEVERLYRDNPRQRVTSTLVELIFNIVCDVTSLTDTFLILYAGFIAAVYRVVGIGFGASVVLRTVEEFDRHYSQREGASITTGESASGKKTTNLMALLGQLYNFQVIGSNLIFDFIRIFLSRISELNTELLLVVIKSKLQLFYLVNAFLVSLSDLLTHGSAAGPKLRQDDPSALKDIILTLQPAIASVGEAALSVRTKFMIETINNLKNNRMKTGVAASAVKSQHMVQMKKLLGSLNLRALRASEPLRLGLEDARNADEKGKWWLVGASWKEGDESLHDLVPLQSSRHQDCTASAEVGDQGSEDLLQLAKEQRMNTDIRRAIFITIVSAADCRDAHERLVKLRLKRAQELEIPRVLIHCAGAEQAYNPYYTLMARRLCGEHRLKMAFQFGLWDLFKRMGEGSDGYRADAEAEMVEEAEDRDLGTRKLVNLAKMFGGLIVEGSLRLGVLKTLDLAYLQPKTRTFVELMLITVFLQSQRNSKGGRDEGAVVDVFMQVTGMPQLARGLGYFVKKVVSKTDVAGGKVERDTVRWGCRIAGNALRAIEMSKPAEE
ncbi:MAG: suppressor of glycerol defect [Geoglossum simile]|nr:MAG: suppressor of glycerol defect [Geoglossum simile]